METTTIKFFEAGTGPGGKGFTHLITHADPACAERQRTSRRGAKVVEGLGLPCSKCASKAVVVPGTNLLVNLVAGTNTVFVDGPTTRATRPVILELLGGERVRQYATYEEARSVANALYRALKG